ncbi:MAG: hypothetical protein ACOY4K_06550 [Pseudomonadota bacterium]
MDPTFTWSADLECIDAGSLSNVVTRLHWRCTGVLGGLDLAATGAAELGAPSSKNFVPAPDSITSDLIRAWAGPAAEGVEAALAEQLQKMASQPEIKRLTAPVPDMEASPAG